MKHKTRKRPFVKADVRRFAKLFKTTGFKNGDLVISAKIYRVSDANYGRKNQTNGIEVVDVFPACPVCSKEGRECVHHHVLYTGGFGDFGAMKFA